MIDTLTLIFAAEIVAALLIIAAYWWPWPKHKFPKGSEDA